MKNDLKYYLIGVLSILWIGSAMELEKTKVTYNISGMTCQGCVNKVNTVLEDIKGVETYDVNLNKGEAVILFNSEITNKLTILDELNKTNFTIDEKQNIEQVKKSWFDKIKSIF